MYHHGRARYLYILLLGAAYILCCCFLTPRLSRRGDKQHCKSLRPPTIGCGQSAIPATMILANHTSLPAKKNVLSYPIQWYNWIKLNLSTKHPYLNSLLKQVIVINWMINPPQRCHSTGTQPANLRNRRPVHLWAFGNERWDQSARSPHGGRTAALAMWPDLSRHPPAVEDTSNGDTTSKGCHQGGWLTTRNVWYSQKGWNKHQLTDLSIEFSVFFSSSMKYRSPNAQQMDVWCWNTDMIKNGMTLA